MAKETCIQRLQKYLRENGVPFETMAHPTVYTAQEVAAVQHVPGEQMAKVVIVRADERNLMLVMPAPHRVAFDKLKALLGAKNVRLANEEEFGDIFPDCDLGAMPPFGHLYNVPVYVDKALSESPHIVFQAGTHRDTVKIRYADFARLAQPTLGDFTTHP
ncbi:MAG: YbaK/EbsC family protein [Chloroflexi bacterium]|nr:YbaK/EbsC family protein [Chloroflexota bacterium]